jgi:Ca2+-binding EF-hand superfamily protein
LKSFRLALRIKIIEQFDASEPSYIETRDIIDKYHETISRENIKRFIDKSVELAKTVYTQPVDNPLSDPRAIEPNKALFKLVYTNDGAFSLNELVALYARHVYGDSSKIATELGKVDAYKTIFDAHLQNIGTDTAKKQEFAQLMSKLNNYLSLHIKAEAIKKNIEEADPNGNGLVDGTIGSLFPSTIGKINFEPNVISR